MFDLVIRGISQAIALTVGGSAGASAAQEIFHQRRKNVTYVHVMPGLYAWRGRKHAYQ